MGEELVEALRGHQMLAVPARCSCGWEGRDITERFRNDWESYSVQFAAHVEAAVLAWVDARLGEADVLEAVCEAIALVSGEVDMGETEAAIGAVREALGLEGER